VPTRWLSLWAPARGPLEIFTLHLPCGRVGDGDRSSMREDGQVTGQSALDEFVRSIRSMCSRGEYLYPVVSAQFQYRERYYGLSSAAMLEDLFFDALSNFVRSHVPGAILLRPPRGEKGYDYEYNGQRVSHKVSAKGAQVIAALWDATKTDVTSWTFPNPVSFTTGDYSRKTLKFDFGGRSVTLRPVASNPECRDSEAALLVQWVAGGQAKILAKWGPIASGSIRVSLPFSNVWAACPPNPATPANEIEMFLGKHSQLKKLSVGDSGVLMTDVFRPGTYVIPEASLTNVPVKPNNRALLVAKDLVAGFMRSSEAQGTFVPSGTWFATYSKPEPPDLYLAQRREFDVLFSSVGSSWHVTGPAGE